MSERGKWVMADAPIAVFAICSTPSDRSRHYISCRRSQRDKPLDTFQDEIQMNKGHETELKLISTPDDLAKVRVLPLLTAALSSADGQRLVSTYFDTPDRCLWKSGMTLRVRQTEQGLVQTLKQQKPSALNQGEWENSVSQNLPDINAVKKTPIGSWFRKRSVRERLQEVFEVNLKRFSATLD